MALTNPRYGVQVSYKPDGIQTTTRTFNYINLAEEVPAEATSYNNVDDYNADMLYGYFSRLINMLTGQTMDSCKLITYRTVGAD